MSAYPLPLVPFEPVDGPDNQYSQFNRPIGKEPYIQAGLKGFEPIQPIKLASHYTSISTADEFYWPSLSELNEEMNPFPWLTGEKERVTFPSDEIVTTPAMYTGPPPTLTPPKPPTIPSVAALATSIVKSSDRLFFISHAMPTIARREWRLVRVNLEDSMAMRPTCLTDGRYLVDFYIRHTSDVRFNATNQRYWLQYHKEHDIVTPSLSSDTHLIRPSDTSARLASRHNLIPFRQWITLTHESTFIHGPFEFAKINGRKSRDRVAQVDWNVLHAHKDIFLNEPPSLDLPSYSVHVDRGVHVAFGSEEIAQQLQKVAALCISSKEQIIR